MFTPICSARMRSQSLMPSVMPSSRRLPIRAKTIWARQKAISGRSRAPCSALEHYAGRAIKEGALPSQTRVRLPVDPGLFIPKSCNACYDCGTKTGPVAGGWRRVSPASVESGAKCSPTAEELGACRAPCLDPSPALPRHVSATGGHGGGEFPSGMRPWHASGQPPGPSRVSPRAVIRRRGTRGTSGAPDAGWSRMHRSGSR